VLSGTIKKRESFVPETIKKQLESYPGWSDLVRRRKKTPPMTKSYLVHLIVYTLQKLLTNHHKWH